MATPSGQQGQRLHTEGGSPAGGRGKSPPSSGQMLYKPPVKCIICPFCSSRFTLPQPEASELRVSLAKSAPRTTQGLCPGTPDLSEQPQAEPRAETLQVPGWMSCLRGCTRGEQPEQPGLILLHSARDQQLGAEQEPWKGAQGEHQALFCRVLAPGGRSKRTWVSESCSSSHRQH